MRLEDLLVRLDKVGAADELLPEALPDMEMYMEQLLITLNGKLNLRSKNDRLTKDMVHVYANNGLLPIPRKKRLYHKEHALVLNLIYQLKDILSIKEIKFLLNLWIKEIESSREGTSHFNEAYSLFADLKNAWFAQWRERIVNNFSQVSAQAKSIEHRTNFQNTDQILIVLLLIVQASVLSQVAKGIIQDYFKNSQTDSVGKTATTLEWS